MHQIFEEAISAQQIQSSSTTIHNQQIFHPRHPNINFTKSKKIRFANSQGTPTKPPHLNKVEIIGGEKLTWKYQSDEHPQWRKHETRSADFGVL